MFLRVAGSPGGRHSAGNAIKLDRGVALTATRTQTLITQTLITESGRSGVSSQVTELTPEDGSSGEFGANEWLVDEMYERYLADKNSVDSSWWPILENYRQIKTDAAIPAVTPEPPHEPAPAEPAPAEPAPAEPAPAEPVPVQQSAPNGNQPVARTTSVQAKPQPIPARS